MRCVAGLARRRRHAGHRPRRCLRTGPPRRSRSRSRHPPTRRLPPGLDAPAALPRRPRHRPGVVRQGADGAPRPIASLTKIMTGAPGAGAAPRWTTSSPSPPRRCSNETTGGAISSLGLRAGERLTVGDLLYALLLAVGERRGRGARGPRRGLRGGVRPGHEPRAAALGMRRHARSPHRTASTTAGCSTRARPAHADAGRLRRDRGSPRSSRRSSARSRPAGRRAAARSRTATRCSGCTRARSA